MRGGGAFSDCSALERVLTFSNNIDVAADALSGCSNVAIFAPYDKDGAYPWNVGLVAAGNHVLPYGLALASEPLSLEVGQSADLFEGGVQEVPAGCELSYSYAATPISVDAGQVTGKKAGTSEVTAVLTLDGQELARATRTVEVKAAETPPMNEVLDSAEAQSNAHLPIFSSIAPLSLDADSEVSPTSVGGTFTQGNYTYTILSEEPGATGSGESYGTVAIAPAANAKDNLTGAVTLPSTVTQGGNTHQSIYTVTRIERLAFQQCPNMTSVVIPSTITYLGASAFYSCRALTSISIPASVKELTALNNDLPALATITIAAGNPNYCVQDGVLYTKDMTRLIACPATKTDAFTIPSGVTELEAHAFMQSQLSSISIPSSVKAINSFALSYCQNVTSFTIPDETVLYAQAIKGCPKLTSIKLAAAGNANILTNLGTNCPALTDIYYKGDVKSIASDAFGGSTVKSNITIALIDGSDKTIWQSAEFSIFGTQWVTVTYEANGGECDVTSVVGDYGGSWQGLFGMKIPQPSASKTGYELDGWYESSTFSGVKWSRNSRFTKNTTLYAKWTPISYTVHFDANGGTGVRPDASAQYDALFLMPDGAGFSKKGYSFSGWCTNKEGTGTTYSSGQKAKNLTTEAGKTVTFYAKWTGQTFQIVYNLNGSQDVVYGTGQTLSTSASPSTGFHLEGWNIRPTGSPSFKPGSSADAVFSYVSGGSVTLFPIYAANQYTVSYHPNGGSGTNPPTQQCTYSTSFTTAANPCTRSGYKFVGWNTQANGEGTSCAANASANNLTATQNGTVTLYAQWRMATHTVTFDANGGTPATSTATVNDEAKVSAPAKNPTKNGATFAGWYTSASEGTAYAFDTPVTSSFTLYAHWTPVNCTVTFSPNEGTGGGSKTVAYGSKVTAFAAPTKKGYTFAGWYTSASGGSQFNFDTPITGNTTLHAHWTANRYYVVFNAHGGDGSMSRLECAYGTAQNLTPNSFTKDGYVFAGWTTYENGSGDFYADKASVNSLADTANATVNLFAQWSPKIECTVPLDARVTIDAAGNTTQDSAGEIVSNTIAPLVVTSIECSEGANASQLIPDPAQRKKVSVLVAPTGSNAVSVPVGGKVSGNSLAHFTLDAAASPTDTATLPLTFGLSVPAGTAVNYLGKDGEAQFATLVYTVATVA